MIPRIMFYRKKKKAWILSGKQKGITQDLLTLPEPNRLVAAKLNLVSFLTKEKLDKILKKVECLDYIKVKDKNPISKVPIIKIKRTPEIDTKQEELNKLLKLDEE